MLTEILHHADLFKEQIFLLKEKAPDFPKLFFEESGGCIWATTMVAFSYNGVDYKRHHVELIVPTKTCTIQNLNDRIFNAATQCIEMGVPSQFDSIVGLTQQLTELELKGD